MSIEEAIESLNSPEQFATTQFYNIKNNCASVLNATIDAIQTSLVLVAGGGALFPAAPFYISCEFEVMKCTGKSTDTLTITRGFDGTTAAAHTAGVIIEQRNNAALWTDLQLAVNNIESGATAIPLNVPDGSITNVKLASDVIRPSLIQNGGFEQWHRGNGPFTASGAITADDWAIGLSGSDTLSVSKDTTNSEYGACAVCTFILNGGGGNTYLNSSSSFGGLLLSDVLGKQVTFTARVRCNVANAVKISIYNGTIRTSSSFHTGNGTYQTLSLTANVANSITSFDVAFLFSASCTVYIDNATLVIGAAGSNYSPAQIPDVISNEHLAADTARTNFLTNGGFEIWQRGNGPFTLSGGYSADRWATGIAGSDTLSISKDSGNIDSIRSLTAAACTFSLNGGGGNTNISQILKLSEGPNNSSATTTFSVRVRTNVANAVRLGFYNNAWVYSSYHTGDGTWQTLSIVSSMSYATVMAQLSIMFSASCTAYIDSAMLVNGSVAADYVPLHPADEIARCMRYYEPIADGALGNPYIFGGYNGATASYYFYMSFKVRKIVTPTMTKNGTWTVFNAGQPSLSGASSDGASMSAAITATGYGYVQCGAAGQSWIGEAN